MIEIIACVVGPCLPLGRRIAAGRAVESMRAATPGPPAGNIGCSAAGELVKSIVGGQAQKAVHVPPGRDGGAPVKIGVSRGTIAAKTVGAIAGGVESVAAPAVGSASKIIAAKATKVVAAKTATIAAKIVAAKATATAVEAPSKSACPAGTCPGS